MAQNSFKAGEIIFKSGSDVKGFYILMKGTVEQVIGATRIVLGPGSCVGLADAFHDAYYGDYRAVEDCVVNPISYSGPDDFVKIFDEMPVYIFGFAKGALRQCRTIFQIYMESKYLAQDFYTIATESYRNYLHLCNEKKMPYKRFTRINYITPATFDNKVDDWEIDYVYSFNDVPNQNIEQIYGGNKAIAIGVIGTACKLMDTAIVALDEIGFWVEKNMDIILNDSKMDLFQLLFDMKARACILGRTVAEIEDEIEYVYGFIKDIGIYPPELVEKKWQAYASYDFAKGTVALNGETGLFMDEEIRDEIKDGGETFTIESEYEVEEEDFPEVTTTLSEEMANVEESGNEDCLQKIFDYVNLDEKSGIEIKKRFKAFTALKNKEDTDDKTRKLRRAITEDYYKLYEACFFRSLNNRNIDPIVEMFLHFGFMDANLAGIDNSNELYDLLAYLPQIKSARVYTIYTWLMAIYKKEKDPSKNELDLDFKGFVQEEKRSGNIKESQVKAFLESADERVKFEIANFFKSANRTTSGKMSAFCPPLIAENFLNGPKKSLLTTKILDDAMDKITNIDFGIFYRDIYFSDPDKGVKSETLKKEVLPDIILLPNAGVRGMMWQEISGIKKDTPARIVFPMFCQESLDKLMVYVCGAFRWEICRREMGVRWNEIGGECLTSDFYDYFTFYKKNKELSTEGKEKVKNLLKKNRNNMREAFTALYTIWINFESSGNVRLNKSEREMLAKYCPFRKSYRDALVGHPMFGDVITRYETKNKQKLHHIDQVYAKYEKMGGTIDDLMKTSRAFYES